MTSHAANNAAPASVTVNTQLFLFQMPRDINQHVPFFLPSTLNLCIFLSLKFTMYPTSPSNEKSEYFMGFTPPSHSQTPPHYPSPMADDYQSRPQRFREDYRGYHGQSYGRGHPKAFDYSRGAHHMAGPPPPPPPPPPHAFGRHGPMHPADPFFYEHLDVDRRRTLFRKVMIGSAIILAGFTVFNLGRGYEYNSLREPGMLHHAEIIDIENARGTHPGFSRPENFGRPGCDKYYKSGWKGPHSGVPPPIPFEEYEYVGQEHEGPFGVPPPPPPPPPPFKGGKHHGKPPKHHKGSKHYGKPPKHHKGQEHCPDGVPPPPPPPPPPFEGGKHHGKPPKHHKGQEHEGPDGVTPPPPPPPEEGKHHEGEQDKSEFRTQKVQAKPQPEQKVESQSEERVEQKLNADAIIEELKADFHKAVEAMEGLQ